MLGKKAASICIIIIGIIVAIPFNYMYGIDGIEDDIVWTIVGIVMTASGCALANIPLFILSPDEYENMKDGDEISLG